MPAFAHFEQFAAATLIAVVWQAALIAGATGLALRLVPRLSAAARFSTWAVVFAILLLLPFVQHTHSTSSVSGWSVGAGWSIAIAVLWLALSCWRAAQLVREFVRVRRIRASARELRAGSEQSAGVLSCAQDDDGRREGTEPWRIVASDVRTTLCLSRDVERPTVLGFFHPAILLPQSLHERLSPAELEHILLHEAQHLRRRDLWLNLAQKIGLVLFPLNPALFWVERRLCFERELACDESVLDVTRAPQSYARSLVSLAEHSLLGRQVSLALGAWGQPSELSRRVLRILAGRAPSLSPRSASAVVALLCAGLLGSAAALSGAPRLIGFANPLPVRSASNAQPIPLLNDANARILPVSTSAQLPHMLTAVVRSASVETPHPARARRAGRRAVPSRRLVASYAAPSRTKQVEARFVTASNTGRAEHGFSRASMQAPVRHQPVVLTVFSSPSAARAYAAVPTPDGWIVFQL